MRDTKRRELNEKTHRRRSDSEEQRNRLWTARLKNGETERETESVSECVFVLLCVCALSKQKARASLHDIIISPSAFGGNLVLDSERPASVHFFTFLTATIPLVRGYPISSCGRSSSFFSLSPSFCVKAK
jgi:hypothetical protein